jgi:iron complex outermembrane receptor protein
MKRKQQQQFMAMVSIATALIAHPAWAQEFERTARGIEIPLSELDQPATTIDEWMQQIAQAAIAQITDVELNITTAGIEIILRTTEEQLAEPSTSVIGNALIADIDNAAIGEEFFQDNPTEGIALISVTNRGENGVRVAITGVETPPTAEIRSHPQGLILAVQIGTETISEPDADAIQVVVTGEQDEGFNPANSTTGSRTDVPLRDLPFSVRVVPQQVLEDQQVQRLTDALRNVPGVQSENSPRSVFEGFTIRGFAGSNNILVNGLSDRFIRSIQVGNIERIEVLRGPASALFSGGGPGGTINVITKQPLSQPDYSLEAGYGSFNTFTGAIDLTGPIDRQGDILYRLNLYGFRSETFVDRFDIRRYSIAPVVLFRLGEDTRLTLEGIHGVFEQPNDRGLPVRGTILPNPNGDLPISRFLGEPSIDNIITRITRMGYRLEHRFDEDWQIRNAFNVALSRQPQNSLFPTLLRDDDRTLERGLIIAQEQESEAYIVNADVVGRFNTGSIEHNLLFGAEWARTVDRSRERFERQIDPIDIFDPDYGSENVGEIIAELPIATTLYDTFGIFLQDQITLLDHLKLLLGGRIDWADQVTISPNVAAASQEDTAFSPRVGIVFQPIDPLSLYASYSRSFNQVIGQTRDNATFDPERGTQFEIGVKADLSDRLSATLAFYDITRSNVLTEDPDDPTFSIQTGEQNSQGIELDIGGEILPGWNIFAGYAYTDARITEDNTFESGNRLNNVPEHAASLWTTYQLRSGTLEGLGFGLGLFYVGDRAGDLNNSFVVPDYLRTDASLFYEQGSFRAAINIRNLLDIEYFETAESDLRVFPGEPLTVLGTISWSF